jgi:translation initiation factor IF-3
LPEALTIARTLDLDLVEVAPMANPPVCRIMDYGKFKFDEAQRAKESRRKTVHVGIKEMKYRPKIGPGDFDTKTRQVARFLGEGHKVKITIMFRGREVFHPELGKRILDRIAEQMGDTAKVEAEPRLDGRNMVMVLAPDKRARQSAASRAGTREGGGPAEAGDGQAPVENAAGQAAGQNEASQDEASQDTAGQNGAPVASPPSAPVQGNGEGPATGAGSTGPAATGATAATAPADGEG